ncbi:MAG: hypothetical protein ACOX2E_01090 [Syntrophaceticus sp.]
MISASGLAEILRALSRVEDELDKAAVSTIISCLEQTAAYSPFELGLEGAVERIADMLGKLRVGNAGPKPGQAAPDRLPQPDLVRSSLHIYCWP